MTSETYFELVMMMADGRIKMPTKREALAYRRTSQFEKMGNGEKEKQDDKIIQLEERVA